MTDLIIGLDFDGTCVLHAYPAVGADVENCVDTLRRLTNEGVRIVLNTMRSGLPLTDAVAWFAERQIPLFGVNRNPEQTWTDSPKVYAHLYIDDAALGCPIKRDSNLSDRVFVDWYKVADLVFAEQHLIEKIHVNLN